jgi:hypothetical protein
MSGSNMGYYMRHIVTDAESISLLQIEHALRAIDSRYSVGDGDLMHGGDLYATVEAQRPGDNLFDEEVQELLAEIQGVRGKGRKKVGIALQNAKAIVAVQVLWQDREAEETLQKLDPLWEWLFINRQGLLQADGEGYYDHAGLILELQ